MDRQAKRLYDLQRARCDHVAAVQHHLGTGLFSGSDSGREQFAVVVTVGDDADFHGLSL